MNVSHESIGVSTGHATAVRHGDVRRAVPFARAGVPMVMMSFWGAVRRGDRYPGLIKLVKGLVGVGVCVVLWETVRALGLIDARDLPAFGAVIRTFVREIAGGPLFAAVIASISSWAPGLVVAAVTGTVGGVALAMLPALEVATRPLLEFLRPIPSVALIPIALLTLGIGAEMQLTMIAFASVWPVLFSVKAGVESVDPRFLETGRVFGLRSFSQVLRIVIPSALPSMATGLRTASAIALVLTITVEMLTGRPGIGRYIEDVRLNGLVTEMWAAIFATGVLGYAVNGGMLMIERRLLPWSAENRES